MSGPVTPGSSLYGRCFIAPTQNALFDVTYLTALALVRLEAGGSVEVGDTLTSSILALLSPRSQTTRNDAAW